MKVQMDRLKQIAEFRFNITKIWSARTKLKLIPKFEVQDCRLPLPPKKKKKTHLKKRKKRIGFEFFGSFVLS